VLHKWANPACPIPFRKLSQGKLFLVETEPLGVSELRRGATRPASHRIEYYWLCEHCGVRVDSVARKGARRGYGAQA
jgi:hypothetical protein